MVDLRDDVHLRPAAELAKHPLPVSGDGESPRPARAVGDRELHELHRLVLRDEDCQFRGNSLVGMFEHRAADPMSHDIRASATGRLRSGRPEAAGIFVADVDGLAARVRDRVIGPWREPELVAVVDPRAAAARLGDHGADARIRQTVDPRCGRGHARLEADHVFAAVGREATEAVEGVEWAWCQLRLECRGGGRWRVGQCESPPRFERRDGDLRPTAFFCLLDQRAAFVGEHHAGGRLQQHAILFRELFATTHENAAGTVDESCLRAGGDESDDRLVQDLSIDGVILVPDDEVDVEAVHPPPGMGANRLVHQFELVAIADADQHDRQIARDAVPPEPRLAATVAGDHRGARPAETRCVDQRPGQSSEGLCFLLGDRELLQHDRTPRPGQFDDAVGEARIGVFDGDLRGLVA